MEAAEMKQKIQNTIEELSSEKLKIILDFLKDLQRSEAEETQALVNEPGFTEEYREAKEDIRTGQTISWEDIKRDV